MMNKKTQNTDFIFGIRTVLEAIEADKQIDRLFIKKGLRGELYGELVKKVRELDIPHQFAPEERLNRITRKNHQGVVAYISAIEYQDIENIIPAIYEKGETPLLLILDSITDVRNMGAISRTAECAGVHALVVPTKGSAQINADAVKTSAGALHSIPVCRVNSLVKTIEFMQQSGIQVIAVSEKADEYYYNADLKTPLALVMGSEDKGINYSIIKISDKFVKIPVMGSIASLNVSVAASVVIYEALKQRMSVDSL